MNIPVERTRTKETVGENDEPRRRLPASHGNRFVGGEKKITILPFLIIIFIKIIVMEFDFF
jgi:hypothetical protein